MLLGDVVDWSVVEVVPGCVVADEVLDGELCVWSDEVVAVGLDVLGDVELEVLDVLCPTANPAHRTRAERV